MSLISEQADQLTQSLYHEKSHIHVEFSTSTNSELIEMISDTENPKLNPKHVHLRTADSQSSGRGQSGRSWQSPKGNVYLSLYYPSQHSHFPLTKPISGLLSLCVGYYLAQLQVILEINKFSTPSDAPLTGGYLRSPIGVKWANDIGYYDSQRLFRKLSGILIEPVLSNGKILGIVIGVGLNVQTAPTLTKQTQEGMSYQSVSLADLLNDKQPPDVHDLYQPISKAIFQAILTHQDISSNDNNLAEFLEDFEKADILQGRKLSVSQNNHREETIKNGTAVGIDKFGCLRLQEQYGQVSSLFTGKIEVVG